jgi:hypothetical protein
MIFASKRRNWTQEGKSFGFESAMHDTRKKRADRQVSERAEHLEQKGTPDFIEQMRQAAVSMNKRAVAEKQLADAATLCWSRRPAEEARRGRGDSAEPRVRPHLLSFHANAAGARR